MILAFVLTMPGVNTWNGRWSGEGELFVDIRNIGRAKASEEKGRALIEGSSYFYRWDDGWCAEVSVSEVTAAEARKMRAKSKGFMGYNWMVNNLLATGEIGDYR